MCETGVIRVPAKAILLRPEADQALLVRHHPDERIAQGFTQISLARRPQDTNLPSGSGIRSSVHVLPVFSR
jgi:hypothetical protein